jgi:copper chaperone NosL
MRLFAMNLPMFKRSLFQAGVLACALLIAGCHKAATSPESIGADDTCYFCKSLIAEPAFAAELITTGGSLYKFDDMACLIASTKIIGKENIRSFYVMDDQTKTWLPAEQAQFVHSDKLRTPRGGGYVAFKEATKAQDLASRFQAELLKFGDLVK